jgi:hypothetical protein
MAVRKWAKSGKRVFSEREREKNLRPNGSKNGENQVPGRQGNIQELIGKKALPANIIGCRK